MEAAGWRLRTGDVPGALVEVKSEESIRAREGIQNEG
jgi:hypothetical protein